MFRYWGCIVLYLKNDVTIFRILQTKVYLDHSSKITARSWSDRVFIILTYVVLFCSFWIKRIAGGGKRGERSGSFLGECQRRKAQANSTMTMTPRFEEVVFTYRKEERSKLQRGSGVGNDVLLRSAGHFHVQARGPMLPGGITSGSLSRKFEPISV